MTKRLNPTWPRTELRLTLAKSIEASPIPLRASVTSPVEFRAVGRLAKLRTRIGHDRLTEPSPSTARSQAVRPLDLPRGRDHVAFALD